MRILLVEDERELAKTLKKGLEKKGYALDWVETIEQATEFLAIYAYDLVLLDLNLPDGFGLDLLTAIRNVNETVKVLILTANQAVDIRIQGFDQGANDYLVKPFIFEELEARMRALLRRDFISQAAEITLGKLTIFTQQQQLSYDQHIIRLTLKEYNIFWYLYQNRNRFMSAEAIFDHVWNDEADPFSQVIRVHMYSLRKKIREIPGLAIETKKGNGYCLHVDEELL
ncbi:MAG: response regulator transcription factor [Culicoidibacterales bacterium]